MLAQSEEKKMLIESMKKLTRFILTHAATSPATLLGRRRFSMRFLCRILIKSSPI